MYFISYQVANNFADIFDNKIDFMKNDLCRKSANLFCSDIMDTTLLSKDTKLECFAPTTTADLLTRKLVKKSCILEPIPAKVLIECCTDLLPFITEITNISLETATVANNLKCAALIQDLRKIVKALPNFQVSGLFQILDLFKNAQRMW